MSWNVLVDVESDFNVFGLGFDLKVLQDREEGSFELEVKLYTDQGVSSELVHVDKVV
jgi:hypothetical protein